jgi:hypothetical protein
MKFRLKAFAWHLLGSACAMAVILGALYLGWYRWPGWYLTGALKIALMMVGFDVLLGPLLTFVIANPAKPRRELMRDVAIIVCVQVIAAGYGTSTLWSGRILFYTYSWKWLEIVQASDLSPVQLELAQKRNPGFVPHWYSLPRWVYASLPKDDKLRDSITMGTLSGGDDVIQMPQYFKPWEAGLQNMRKDLRLVDKMGEFAPSELRRLKEHMQRLGYPPQSTQAIPMIGRSGRLVAIVDPKTAQIDTIISAN